MTLEELSSDINKCAKTRFLTARRHEWHHKLSRWTITMASVGLLLIPLIQAFGLEAKWSNNELSVVQVVLAVVVLVFGLLLSYEDHSKIADRMHRCGMDLKALYRKVGEDEFQDLEVVANAYDAILSRYRNHLPIDYKMFKLDNRLEYYPKYREYLCAYVLTRSQYMLGFSIYVFLLAIIVTSIIIAIGGIDLSAPN